ncbi:uncharacterized protein LOC126322420 [Schistocerca gregaria]|uniref:uncharacterized protein LOC126322420 n=1 Tax=Schistocerca gregaria TaxID=7010 RepID=UPI00211DB64A|nr:uncharacterized protein LOC126322420 [Schistocerca gregaria]
MKQSVKSNHSQTSYLDGANANGAAYSSRDYQRSSKSNQNPPSLSPNSKKKNETQFSANKVTATNAPDVCPISDIPTTTIKVTGLVRPFKITDLKDMLVEAGNGEILDFKIDSIMSECYAVYETEAAAEKAKQSIHNTKWPSTPGARTLTVEFVDEHDAFPSRMPTLEESLNKFRTEEHNRLVSDGFMFTKAEPKLYFLPRSEESIPKMQSNSTSNSNADEIQESPKNETANDLTDQASFEKLNDE